MTSFTERTEYICDSLITTAKSLHDIKRTLLEKHESSDLEIILERYSINDIDQEPLGIVNLIDIGDFKQAIRKIRQFYSIFNIDILVEEISRAGINPELLLENLYSYVDVLSEGSQYQNPAKVLSPVLLDLTEELVRNISNSPELLFTIQPRQFEEIIGKVFSKFNMKINLTKQTRDGGYDIIAFKDDFYTKNKYIIECKRYAKEKKVSIDVVQRLYGIKQSIGATKAFIVISSSFSKTAIDFARKHQWELDLIDFNDLTKWLAHYWKTD